MQIAGFRVEVELMIGENILASKSLAAVVLTTCLRIPPARRKAACRRSARARRQEGVKREALVFPTNFRNAHFDSV